LEQVGDNLSDELGKARDAARKRARGGKPTLAPAEPEETQWWGRILPSDLFDDDEDAA
jgi:hypothetical protein